MLRLFIASAALILLTAPACAEIYKCRLSNGQTEIANVPCPTGSGTVTVRPDERVSEASRRAAEQDVERMRNFVEKREAAQRAEAAAEREAQAASQRQGIDAPRAPRQVGNADECLRNVESMVLEAGQRARMEAECRNLVNPQPVYVPIGVPVGVPVYPPRRHIHPPPATAPKAEPPSAPKTVLPPLKK